MKLTKEQMEDFTKQYNFLLKCDQDEGSWTGLFKYGGDTEFLAIEHNKELGVFEVLCQCNCLGYISSKTPTKLKKIVEFLVEGDIDDLPDELCRY